MDHQTHWPWFFQLKGSKISKWGTCNTLLQLTMNSFIRPSFMCISGNIIFLMSTSDTWRMWDHKVWAQILEINSRLSNSSLQFCCPTCTESRDTWCIWDVDQEITIIFQGQYRWSSSVWDIAITQWLSLCLHTFHKDKRNNQLGLHQINYYCEEWYTLSPTLSYQGTVTIQRIKIHNSSSEPCNGNTQTDCHLGSTEEIHSLIFRASFSYSCSNPLRAETSSISISVSLLSRSSSSLSRSSRKCNWTRTGNGISPEYFVFSWYILRFL